MKDQEPQAPPDEESLPTESAMAKYRPHWHLPSPRTIAEAMALAKVIAESSLCPTSYRGKPYDVLLCVQHGAEVGLPPLQALQSIAVINGRPTIFGDAALALVRSSGLLEDFDEDDTSVIAKTRRGRCLVKRKGMRALERTFSEEDARAANLWYVPPKTPGGPSQGKANTPWQSYPHRMLQMRARSWALRDGFGDILKGLQIHEEVQDFPDPTVAPTSQPEHEAPSGQTQTEKLKEKLKTATGQATPPPSQEPEPPPQPPLEPEGRKISGQVRGITAPAGSKPGTIKIGTDEALITAWFREPPPVLAALDPSQWWELNGRMCTAWVAERLNQRKQVFVVLTGLELAPEDDVPDFTDPVEKAEREAIKGESE